MANANASRRASQRQDNDSSAAPRWVVFMGGLTSGVLLTVLVGAVMWPRFLAPAATGEEQADESQATGEAAPRRSPVDYEYEDVLARAEVPGPDPTVAASISTLAAPEKPPPPQPERSALQAGSFREAADADALRARLLLLDIGNVTTREALIDGVVWHRVMVGPFATDAERKRAQAKLAGENINSLPIAAPADMRAPSNDPSNDPSVDPSNDSPPATTPRADAATG